MLLVSDVFIWTDIEENASGIFMEVLWDNYGNLWESMEIYGKLWEYVWETVGNCGNVWEWVWETVEDYVNLQHSLGID